MSLRLRATCTGFPRLAPLAALLLLSWSAAPCQGQGRGGQGLELRVPRDRVEMPAPGVPEFDVGSVRSDGARIRVEIDAPGRRPWRLLVRSADPDLGGYGKPLSDLEWRIAAGGPWTRLSTQDELVTCGRGADRVELDFRMHLEYRSDRPDRYGADLEFQLAPGGGCA